MKIKGNQPTNILLVAAVVIDLHKAANHLKHARERFTELGIFSDVIDLDALERAEQVAREFLDNHRLQFQQRTPGDPDPSSVGVPRNWPVPPLEHFVPPVVDARPTFSTAQLTWKDTESGTTYTFAIRACEYPKDMEFHAFKPSVAKAIFKAPGSVDPASFVYIDAYYVRTDLAKTTLPGESSSIL